jgi:recombination associated protein RdgC
MRPRPATWWARPTCRSPAWATCAPLRALRPTQPESTGWVPPRGNKGKVLAELVGGHLVLKLCTEKRAVPASAVKSAVDERVEKYKTETGNERVPAKIKKEFKEEVLLDLLPRAFSKRSTTLLWLDALNKHAGGRCRQPRRRRPRSSRPAGGAARSARRRPGAGPADGAHADLAGRLMSHWLSTREAPWRFTVDRDCELKTPDEQKSTVRYARHTLDIDEVRAAHRRRQGAHAAGDDLERARVLRADRSRPDAQAEDAGRGA